MLEEYESALRHYWNPERLGEYEGKWIAFTTEVIGENEDLDKLLEIVERMSDEHPEFNDANTSPIFAYVTFDEVFI